MKKRIYSLLLLFMVTISFAQGIITPFDQIKLKGNLKKNSATRVMVQDSITGVCGWVLKSSITSGGGSVNEVLEYTNYAAFPATGSTGKIYVDKSLNKIYRWNGSTYVLLSPETQNLQDVASNDNHLEDRDILLRNTADSNLKANINSYYAKYFDTDTGDETKIEGAKLSTPKLKLYDAAAAAYGSQYLTDGNLIFTDTSDNNFLTVDNTGIMSIIDSGDTNKALTFGRSTTFTANRSCFFPNKSGTVQYADDVAAAVSNKVPYTGATADVDINTHKFYGYGLYGTTSQTSTLYAFDTFNVVGPAYNFESWFNVNQNGLFIVGDWNNNHNSTYFKLKDSGTDKYIKANAGDGFQFSSNTGKFATVKTTSLTADRSYEYPDASGTLFLKPTGTTSQVVLGDGTLGSVSISQDLDQTLTNGNFSTQDARIGELGLFDTTNSNYGTIGISNNDFNFSDSGGNLSFVADNSGYLRTINTTSHNSLTLTGTSSFSTSRTATFPNRNITVAGTDDVATKQDILSGTGFVKSTAGTISYDTNTYLTTSSASSTYQPILISGTNIKTINSTSLLGSGNVSVEPTVSAGTTSQYYRGDKSWQTLDKTAVGLSNVVNTDFSVASNLPSTIDAAKINTGVVSNAEFNYLDGVTSAIQTQLDAKSDKSFGAYKMRANNTNATANATEQTFRAQSQQSYGGTMTFSFSGSAPTGTPDATYSWMQIGNQVSLTFSATYPGAGSGVTQVIIPLPSDMPTPVKPTGRSSGSDKIGVANGQMMATTTGTTASAFSSYLRSNSTNTGFEFVITQSSGAYKVIDLTCTYFVN